MSDHMSISLTRDQKRYLENACQLISAETGRDISESELLQRMLEKGLPHIDAELQRLRAKTNREAKRFSHLEIALG